MIPLLSYRGMQNAERALSRFQLTRQTLESLGLTVLSTPDEYTNEKSRIRFICKCGNETSIRGADLRSGNNRPHCKDCAELAKAQPNPDALRRRELKKREILEVCSHYGVTPHLENYESIHKKISFTCECGRQFQRTWANASRGNRSPRCNVCNQTHLRLGAFRDLDPLSGRDFSEYVNNRESRYSWYSSWEDAVKATWHGRCAITGLAANLVPHHLYSFAAYPEFRNSVANGVLLTKEMHDLFHTLYGTRRNTLYQFSHFYHAQLSKTFPVTLEQIRESCRADWPI